MSQREPGADHDSPVLSVLEPTKKEVDSLITRAEAHPLGIDFLRRGALDSVAAMFETHAFVVERARGKLGAL